MSSFLNGLFIEPIKLIFEFIFTLSYRVTGNEGISIVVLSLVLNILLLPMYKKADEIQNKENELQKKMKPDVDFIKKTFSGDEQFMMLQTYYRQHNYKPIYALRSAISLFLQIPFFIAAYSFLSNLGELENEVFGPIANLSEPDHLLFGLNLLPILMTMVNIVSSMIYAKDQPLKSKIQLYLMALLFLVLLYDTRSALSLYYLLNNVFSLIKNVFTRIKNKYRVLSVLGMCFCISGMLYIRPSVFGAKGKIVFYGLLLLFFCLCIYVFTKNSFPDTEYLDKLLPPSNTRDFLMCTFFISVLTGFLIPSSVIGASPEEFIDKTFFINPIKYIFNTFILAAGLFIVWFNIFYYLLKENVRKVLSVLMYILCITSVINFMFFNKDFGTMSNRLVYDVLPSYSGKELLENLLFTAIIAALIFFVYIKRSGLLKNSVLVIATVICIMSAINIFSIKTKADKAIIKYNEHSNLGDTLFSLSKTGKNTIVFMLDRAIGYYFPYLLEENPGLAEQFSGFTYYPNTVSFGGHTIIGAPPLFGGYDYVPEEMNKRISEPLVKKHDEALKVLPVLFDDSGYDVTVCDAPFAGYSWIPDLSIYDEYPGIKKYITEGRYSKGDENSLQILERNLFCFSLTKIVPNMFFSVLYDQGNYLMMGTNSVNEESFINSYEVLKNLTKMTGITDDGSGTFLMITNNTTHQPVYLSDSDYGLVKESEYEYKGKTITKKSINGDVLTLKDSDNLETNQIVHYQINMASLIQLGDWFDYLKKSNVYDNTRIIVVSDHGHNLGLREDLIFGDDDLLYYNPLLLFKDFNSQEFTFDDSFMTNGYVPYLATSGLIEKPINPFTGTEIAKEDNEGKELKIFATHIYDTNQNNGNTFIKDKWYSVHDNCLDINNWKHIDDPND